MRIFILFFFLSFTTYAQTYQDMFSGRVTDGDTTIASQDYSLVTATGNKLFDTLHVLIQAGDSTAAAGIIYGQVYALNRWSQGIPLDTLTAAAGNTTISYPLDLNSVTTYLTDTLRNRWFLSTGAGTTAKARILANNGWKIRFFVVGTTGNPTGGGYFKITNFRW